MHRADQGTPPVPAVPSDRHAERAPRAGGVGLDLRIVALLVIPVVAATCIAWQFRALTIDAEDASRLAVRVGRERMLAVRMAWHAERVVQGDDSARLALAADEQEFARVLNELQDLRPQADGRSAIPAMALHLAIEQVVLDRDRMTPALIRVLTPGTGAVESRTALEDIRVGVPTLLRDVENVIDRLQRLQAGQARLQTQRVAALALLQALCVLCIILWFAFGLRRARVREVELRRLAQIARHTSSGLAIADADRRILWANDACAVLTLREATTLRGMPIDEWLREALDVSGRPIAPTFTRGFRCEAQLSRASGLPVWVDLEIVPVRDERGDIEQYVITLQDITARLETAQALQESEARFRSALEAMQEGLVVQSADGTIEIANSAAERVLGLTADQMCGRTSLDPRWRAVHEDGTPFPGDSHPSMVSLGTGVEQRGVIMGVHKPSGELTWISIDTGLIRRPGERKPHKVVCTFADITARRRADESLRKLTRVVEQSPTAVVITDADAHIEYVNRAFTRITGYSGDEVIGHDPRMLASGRTARVVYEDMWAALRMGLEWRGEVINHGKDGRELLIELAIFPLRGDGGEITHFVALEEDVTEARRREAELAAAREEAVAAARAKAEFVQNVSHELRTPMNGILGMSELLLQSTLTPEQHNDVVTLRQSADRLLGIITQLFDFARLGANEEPVERSPFRLRACLREVSEKLAIDATERQLGWEMTVGDDVPDTLVGDSGGLRQVLFHLLDNAVKFTERGGVHLHVTLADGSLATPRLRFVVRDTGIGIPTEQRSRIFEAFQQADGSHTRRFGGMGLGLTLASQLVARLGGTLAVESAVGRGSTFACELPFGPAAGAGSARADARALEGAPVLVVDGGGALRTGILHALERWGVNVQLVPGPDAALAAARHADAQGHPFRFLLLDQRSGSFDPFAAAQRLQESDAALPPILMLIAAGHASDVARCEAHGVAGCLVEPVNDEDLHELMRRAAAPRGGKVITAGDLQAARRQQRLLLVEDNPVNRKVATRLLERSGFRVIVAVDGREAVEKVAADTFDAVLMDIQMPEMDGLEATRRIRAAEAGTGRRLPIIALTAHTLGADIEAARAAGMDDLVAKPIRADVLFDSIRRFLDPEAMDAPAADPATAPLDVVLDWDEALDRMDGDEAVLRELLQLFVTDSVNMLKRLDDACQAGDLKLLERSAHGLKGASATISGRLVAPLARRVEQLARDGQSVEALAAAAELEHEMRRLVATLAAMPHTGREAA